MKKFFLYAAAIGILPAAVSILPTTANAVVAVEGITQGTVAMQQAQYQVMDDLGGGGGGGTSTYIPTTTTPTTGTTTTTTGTTVKTINGVATTQFKKADLLTLTVSDRLIVLEDQINDSTRTDVDVVSDDIIATLPNTAIQIDTIPCVTFDSDVVDVAEFKTDFEVDDNGFKTVDLTVDEFKPFITPVKHPQLYKIAEWDPEVETINPLKNRAGYCAKYPSKCVLDTTLVSKFITNKKFRKLKLCRRPEIIPIDFDLKCIGVKCGEGQECNDGCCEYQKDATVADITLKPVLLDRYKIENFELVATDAALKDETAKLVLDDPVVAEEILNKKVLMEEATVAAQAKWQALKVAK